MAYSPINCHHLAQKVGSWLTPAGPESDVVISCRIRLARNLQGHHFVSRLEAAAAEAVADKLRASLEEIAIDGETFWIEMQSAPPLLRMLLRERHLVSRDLAPGDGKRVAAGRAVAFGATESVSVMVNEEDHVRIQGMAGGFNFDLACERALDLDRRLEGIHEFAYNETLGYLTGCPTNVGTGLRASVMLHLPALGLVHSELEKVFTAAQRTGLAVRGLYGEGTRAAGDFYQLSNQVTLGRSESDLIDDLRTLVPIVAEFERKIRKALVEEQEAALRDRIMRSYGTLRSARAMRTDVALAHLSNVRLGHHLGLLSGVSSVDLFNELGVQIQRGHIQALHEDQGDEDLLEVSDRDRLRASFLRRRLAEA